MDEYYKLEEKTPGVPSAEKARAISRKTLRKVYKKVGFAQF